MRVAEGVGSMLIVDERVATAAAVGVSTCVVTELGVSTLVEQAAINVIAVKLENTGMAARSAIVFTPASSRRRCNQPLVQSSATSQAV